MTTTTVEVPTSVVDAIAAAKAARAAGIAQAEEADRTGWNTALIDQAIKAFAETGRPFSANDLRHVLPDDLPSALYGARFMSAAKQGLIRKAGYVPSTKESTHAHEIRVWVGTAHD